MALSFRPEPASSTGRCTASWSPTPSLGPLCGAHTALCLLPSSPLPEPSPPQFPCGRGLTACRPGRGSPPPGAAPAPGAKSSPCFVNMALLARGPAASSATSQWPHLLPCLMAGLWQRPTPRLGEPNPSPSGPYAKQVPPLPGMTVWLRQILPGLLGRTGSLRTGGWKPPSPPGASVPETFSVAGCRSAPRRTV